MTFVAEVLGVQEAQKKLDAIGRKTGRKLLGKGMRRLAKPLLSEVRAKAPKDTGELAKSLKMVARAGTGKSDTVATVEIGQAKRTPDHIRRRAIAVEFGNARTPRQPFFIESVAAHAPRILEGLKQDVLRELLTFKDDSKP